MDVLMPQLGETVAEGKISTWYKSVGDAVKPGDNLFEIETDKVSMEVPATSAGVISEIRVSAGETAPVGAVVAVIAGAAGATPNPQVSATATLQKAATGAPPATPKSVESSPPFVPAQAGTQQYAQRPRQELGPRLRGDERRRMQVPPLALDPFFEVRTPERNYGPARIAGGVTVTPLARRLASERGIDLQNIKLSGSQRRIFARDVEQAARAPAPAGAASLAAGFTTEQVRALYSDTPHEEVALDGMRATIAARLLQAKQTIPHFYLTLDVELERLLVLREEANAGAKEGAAKLSINDFILKAWALALQRVPAANAVWAGDRILRFKQSDVGVAVAMEGGLITPIIRDAETKSISAISTEMKELAARARARKLKPAEYQGGASVISNLGMYGVREFAAIINPPHATILAVGAPQRRPVETEDGGVKFVAQMTVTLSCDHRVVDGALGAELLGAFKVLLERPVLMLV
jgi:pyruvate dehydrogenase E2 component (dihydrolipoamide acetyltransferase)